MNHYMISVGINPSQADKELTVMFCGQGQPLPSHKIGPTLHGYYLVHTVTAGQGHFEMKDKAYTCRSGDTFFIYPDEVVSYQADDRNPWQYHWVAFKGEGAERILSSIGVTPDHPIIHTANYSRLIRIYQRIRLYLLKERQEALADLEAGGLFRLLLKQLGEANAERLPNPSKPASDMERQIGQAVRWLTVQFAEPISIDQMSKALGYHRTHLSKMFKRHTGMSPMQYLQHIRMERAKELLESRLTIEQVAASVGIGDALYFSKMFRKRYGLSPTAYRSALRR